MGRTRNILYSMEQLAQYCGRAYATIRTYYTFEGFLPDPEYTIKHGRKTTRKFTLKEMRNIKRILDRVGWGDLSQYTRPRRQKVSTD